MHKDIEEMFHLTGKVAVVIGGAVHLGFDMSTVLAAAGCHVVLTSRDMDKAHAAAEKLRKDYSGDFLPLQLDQTKYEDVVHVTKTIRSWKGRADILINNAGGGAGRHAGELFDRPAQGIADIIHLNLTGMIFCCKEIGAFMAEKGYGKIINISSITGVVGRDRRLYQRHHMNGQSVEYAAAKSGVIGLTKDLGAYLAPKGIYVNSISPGGFNRDLPEGFVKDYSDRTPLGRMGRDQMDIKGAVLFLAAPASDYITGHNLVVDGGFTIWQ